LDYIGSLIEFPEVALSELAPLLRIMSEPLAQSGAWRHVFEPVIEQKLVFRDASGPEAIDENPASIGSRWNVVGPLQFHL
jgi:hypothetical protein